MAVQKKQEVTREKEDCIPKSAVADICVCLTVLIL